MLREQLDQATAANLSLTSDIHKLTADWQKVREELDIKENQWREEEQSFNDYFSAEHGRLRSLWRAIVAFRRNYSELKTATERDLSHVRQDVTKAARSMHTACLNLNANNRNTETQSQRQEAEQELRMKIEKLQAERSSLQKKVQALQRALTTLETEKRETERDQIRLEKDKSALQKLLTKYVEREKLRSEELASKSVMEHTSLDRSLCKVEEDLAIKVQNLQAQLAKAEQQHAQRENALQAKLTDLTTRQRADTEMETERLRKAQMQAERLLDSRERANRQKVKGMEETIATLKDQLATEMRKRQQYIQRSARTGDEKKNDIRSMLDNSLTTVGRDPSLERQLLEIETRKLDDSLDVHSYQARTPTRRRSPMRTQATPPTRLGARSPFGRTGSPMSMRKLKK
ncbi:rootletin-like [Mercenaria mercenaria]|uniref:rootletin-like n=1 Tax=Mercenaria mercenaria TaxID=6596 RepID=UPI00234E9562|nr:rootletin-like [Mercenaria mercenaria]